MPMQGGSLYHFYDGLWYDPAERRTHNLPCERRTRYRLSQPDTVFNKANQALQNDKALIHKTCRILNDLYKSVLLKFIKPSAFRSRTVLGINITASSSQKSDNDLMLGEHCRTFMKKKKMQQEKVKAVCHNARKFYVKAAQYMKKNLRLKDKLLFLT